jgi:hypothetical protein
MAMMHEPTSPRHERAALHVSASLSAPTAVDNLFGLIPLDEITIEAALRRSLRAGDVTRLLSPVNPDLVVPSLTIKDETAGNVETAPDTVPS